MLVSVTSQESYCTYQSQAMESHPSSDRSKTIFARPTRRPVPLLLWLWNSRTSLGQLRTFWKTPQYTASLHAAKFTKFANWGLVLEKWDSFKILRRHLCPVYMLHFFVCHPVHLHVLSHTHTPDLIQQQIDWFSVLCSFFVRLLTKSQQTGRCQLNTANKHTCTNTIIKISHTSGLLQLQFARTDFRDFLAEMFLSKRAIRNVFSMSTQLTRELLLHDTS